MIFNNAEESTHGWTHGWIEWKISNMPGNQRYDEVVFYMVDNNFISKYKEWG